MASSQDAQVIAADGEDDATAFLAAINRLRNFIHHNQSHAIDWGNQVTPEEIPLEQNGNVAGHRFTPAEFSNMIGSAAAVLDWLDTNGHTGNFEKVARPS